MELDGGQPACIRRGIKTEQAEIYCFRMEMQPPGCSRFFFSHEDFFSIYYFYISNRKYYSMSKNSDNKRGPGRPKRNDLIRTGCARGLPSTHTRYTAVLSHETLRRFRVFASKENLSFKDAMETVVVTFMEEYEKNSKFGGLKNEK